MASPVREFSEFPHRPVFVRSNYTISAEKWASIMGQQPAFTRSGDSLYISRGEGLRGAKGICLAFAFETLGVMCAIGLWHLLH